MTVKRNVDSSSLQQATTTPIVVTVVNNNDVDDDDDDTYNDDDDSVIREVNASRLEQAKSFYAEHCIYLPAMLGWFVFSAALSSYNKVVFGQTQRAFPCPLLMTSVHFASQWIFSFVVSSIFPDFFGTSRITSMMSWYEWITTSIPCGLVTSGDVGLSNLSMVYVTMTFYTMIKSTTPIFVLLWAYIFGIEQMTINLLLVVLIITIGEVLTVEGEVDFNPVGFALVLTASMLSGARWTLVQLKLRTMDPPLKTTIATMRLLAPSMFWSLLATSMLIERPWIRLADRTWHENVHDVLGLGMLGATIAISMILCEFWLIMQASAIVLMIGGVMKEMITIFVGVFYFGDEINRINATGCAIVFCGIFFYKITHYLDAQREKQLSTNANTIATTTSRRGETRPLTEHDRNNYDRVERQQKCVVAAAAVMENGEGIQQRRTPLKSSETVETSSMRTFESEMC